ncbi:hypothetical protein HA44_13280 [Mixta gaviniae]|nr:hypothetical protein HA44_13280 [Mixta gaviniae]
MVDNQPAPGAEGQHGAFDFSVCFLAGADAQTRVDRTGTENGDIGAVALQRRQRGGAGEQALIVIPLPPSRISSIPGRSLNAAGEYSSER